VGGEEFLVLCPRSDAAGALAAAERLRAAVEAMAIEHPNGPFRVTISLGVAERADDMERSDDLLKRADEALYEAKRGGRNRVAMPPGSSATPATAVPERRSA
jgi:diguanylate cyclase (GGDEF)-like protein